MALTPAEARLVRNNLNRAASQRGPRVKAAMAKWRALGKPSVSAATGGAGPGATTSTRTSQGQGAPGSSTSYLSKKQFEKINPYGEFDRYVGFIAKRTGLKKEQIQRLATGVDAATFAKMYESSKTKLTQIERRYARQVATGFRRAGHPEMAKYANLFVMAGRLSGYDPRFIAAFAAQESAWGQATPGNAPYNFWGWSVNTGQQHSSIASPFQNPKTAFEYYGKSLKERYGGASSVYSPTWSAYAADPAHESKIAGILSQYFQGNPQDIRYG